MKKLLIFTILILMTSVANAEWYIINSETNRCVGITQYEPDQEDISSRGEFAVFVKNASVSLDDAEYFNGQIRERVKSQAEKNKEQEEKDKIEKYKADSDAAKAKLIELGLTEDEVNVLIN